MTVTNDGDLERADSVASSMDIFETSTSNLTKDIFGLNITPTKTGMD
jgi:hypothetical protein